MSDFSVISSYPAIGSTTSSLSGRSSGFAAYNGVYLMDSGGYYSPPINKKDLIDLMDANRHHGRAMHYISDRIVEFLAPDNQLFDPYILKDLTLEAEATGDGFLRLIKNVLGDVIGLEYIPAVYTVRLTDPNRYGYFINGRLVKFNVGEIFHFRFKDLLQNIYGKPQWYDKGTAALLGEDALLSVRKALNGEGHTNEKIVATGGLPKEQHDKVDELLKETKNGSGRTITMHFPKGSKLAESIFVSRPENILKTDFPALYQLSVDTINEINMLPPEVMGQRSDVAGGNIDLLKLDKQVFRNVAKPRQIHYQKINRYLPPGAELKFANPVSYEQIDAGM